MKGCGVVRLLITVLIALLTSSGIAFAENPGDAFVKFVEKDYARTVLPAGASVVEVYEPGEGKAVGQAEFVQNDAYIIHKNAPQTAFKAKKGLPVFQGDTLLTEAKSSMIVLLNDQSRMTLGAYSKLVIDKSVYDAQKGERDTVVSMLLGKVRYLVKKFGARKEDFRVSTPLATIGVRGSDFVVAMVPEEDVEGGQSSSWWERLDVVSSAHATPGDVIYTLTGADTSLSLTGPGGTQTLGSFNSNFAFQNRITSPVPVTPSLATGVMNRAMPTPTIMSMPELLE